MDGWIYGDNSGFSTYVEIEVIIGRLMLPTTNLIYCPYNLYYI